MLELQAAVRTCVRACVWHACVRVCVRVPVHVDRTNASDPTRQDGSEHLLGQCRVQLGVIRKLQAPYADRAAKSIIVARQQ